MKRLIRIEKDPKVVLVKDIKSFLNPDYILLPNNNKYKINDYVYMSNSCSISGVVKNISNDLITIENDFRELTNPDNQKSKITSKDDIIKLLPECNNVKSIIVNAINDNPYVYNRIFLLKENISNILETIDMISNILNINNNMIAVKNNESFIIDECLNVIGTYPKIKIALLSPDYLIGYSNYLLKKLNIVNNTLYLTVEDIIDLYNKLNGYLETTKLITITYNNMSLLIRVKIGTPLNLIIAKYFKITGKRCHFIINGLMSGYEANIESIFITKDVDSIFINNKKRLKEQTCINCGLCENVCPENIKIHNGKNIEKCLHCGLCSYICPAHIDLERFLGDYHE